MMNGSTKQIEVGMKVSATEYKQLVINAKIAGLPLEEYIPIYLSENMKTDMNGNVPHPLQRPLPSEEGNKEGEKATA